jgi:sterol desaturase/sphingolipid hydroxylase (fatty acid hydroxylase superfamily)
MSDFPPWLTPVIVVVAFAATALAETVSALRPRRESRLRRTVRNLATGGFAAAMVIPLQMLILLPVSVWVQTNEIGLLGMVSWPGWVEVIVAFLLLDYTLWWWHRINHIVPFFWRFHLVHHVDRDLDASTAFRFHFVELGFSVGVRSLQIALIGAGPFAVAVWQAVLFVCILFHHSNLRLPLRLERWIVPVIVTPRMHGIHHSNFRNETDSNWSSIFTIWDILHRTLLLNVPQDQIEIGVPAYREEEDVSFLNLQLNPFRSQRDDWEVSSERPAIREHAEDRWTLAR